MPFRFNPFTGNFDEVVTTATAAGSDTQVQYNDGGSLSGSADLTWDDSTKELGIGGDINLDDGGTYTTTVQCVTPTANRTISFPDATGTVALVAGSNGQLLYNNAGALGGVSALTFDGTSLTALGRLISSVNGADSAPPVALTGTWFTGGTATTTKPAFLVEPAGTTSTAWSTAGTGLGLNAPSGFTGNLADFQINGVSRFRVGSNGDIFGNAATTSVAGLMAATDKVKLDAAVISDPTGITGADAVTNIVSLTQAEYDAIATPSATTLYVITD